MKCDNCNNSIGVNSVNNVSTFHYSDSHGESGYCLCVVCAKKIKGLLDGGKL